MAMDMPTKASRKEIDLYDFCLILWKSKLLIFSITAIAIGIAAAYAFLTPTVYVVSAHLLPPTTHDLAKYNLAAQITSRGYETGHRDPGAPDDTQIEKLAPLDAYFAFLRNLNSMNIKLEFFNKIYLPAYGSSANGPERQNLLKRMEKELGVNLPQDKARNPATWVSLQGHDPKAAANMVNKYVAMAVDATKASLIQNLKAQIQTRSIAVDSQIKAYRQTTHTGLPPNVNEGSKDLPRNVENALNSDIANATLRNLLTQKALLSGITPPNPSDFSVVNIDHAADTFMKVLKSPKRLSAMVVGAVFGFMLGVLAAVIRRPFTN